MKPIANVIRLEKFHSSEGADAPGSLGRSKNQSLRTWASRKKAPTVVDRRPTKVVALDRMGPQRFHLLHGRWSGPTQDLSTVAKQGPQVAGDGWLRAIESIFGPGVDQAEELKALACCSDASQV